MDVLGYNEGDEADLSGNSVSGALAGELVPAAERLHGMTYRLQKEAQGRQDLQGWNWRVPPHTVIP